MHDFLSMDLGQSLQGEIHVNSGIMVGEFGVKFLKILVLCVLSNETNTSRKAVFENIVDVDHVLAIFEILEHLNFSHNFLFGDYQLAKDYEA